MKSRFVYISQCCKVSATKPPCVAVPKVAKKAKKGRKGDDKPQQEFASLGHWSCTQCGKGCKVSRTNAPEEKPKQ
jgi:hypothetical protein